MKKLLALLLCLVMVVSMFAACGGDGGKDTTAGTTQGTNPPETTGAPVVAEPIPDAAYHWSFDDATGLTAVTQGEKAADSINDGATYDIVASDHEIQFANGPVGQCLYLDGKYGVKLDLESLDTDTYTVSFWLNADRLSNFGPTVQIGRNIGDAGDDRTVAWLNFTKATWGTNEADLFPVAWNRNSEHDVWPWVACFDDTVHGKKEWILVTIVSTGEQYTFTDIETGAQGPRIGCRYYLNGSLVFDASDTSLALYQGLSPEILSGDGIEGYIGVNYWDTIFKGYIDELYIFKSALTDGQVLSLYEEGDPTVVPVAPEAGSDEPEAPTPTPVTDITPNPDAIDVLGTTDFSMGFWSDATGSVELVDGGKVAMKLHNYSDCAANWDNFVIGLCNTPVTTDKLPSAAEYDGYAEWAVIRADAFGWAPEGAVFTPTYEMSWTDWNAWLCLMADADVEILLTRNGGEVTIDMVFTGADGTVMTSRTVVVSNLTAADPCHVFLTGDHCYIELLLSEKIS